MKSCFPSKQSRLADIHRIHGPRRSTAQSDLLVSQRLFLSAFLCFSPLPILCPFFFFPPSLSLCPRLSLESLVSIPSLPVRRLVFFQTIPSFPLPLPLLVPSRLFFHSPVCPTLLSHALPTANVSSRSCAISAPTPGAQKWIKKSPFSC